MTELEVGIAVGALTSLRRGTEMEARALDLARCGTKDTAIAALLTQEGFRSPPHSQVPVNTVRGIPRHDGRLAYDTGLGRIARQPSLPALPFPLLAVLTANFVKASSLPACPHFGQALGWQARQ